MKRSNNEITADETEKQSIQIVAAADFSQAAAIAEDIRAKHYVILNLEQMTQPDKQRLLDYLTGACHMLSCTMQPVTENAYIFAPDGTVEAEGAELQY